jgi:hypothetical protein
LVRSPAEEMRTRRSVAVKLELIRMRIPRTEAFCDISGRDRDSEAALVRD